MKAETLALFLIAIVVNDTFCENRRENPRKVLYKITNQFGQAVLECRKEVGFDTAIVDEFLQFWRPEHAIEQAELGCVFSCVLLKLELLDSKDQVQEENALGFARANYADDQLAHQLLRYFKSCMQKNGTEVSRDPCAAGFALATCFRVAMFQHRMAPQPDAVYYDEY